MSYILVDVESDGPIPAEFFHYSTHRFGLAEAVETEFDRYIVTRRGNPIMMMLNPEDYDGLLETIEILSDRSALKRIRKSREEARAGKTISLESLRKRLERV